MKVYICPKRWLWYEECFLKLLEAKLKEVTFITINTKCISTIVCSFYSLLEVILPFSNRFCLMIMCIIPWYQRRMLDYVQCLQQHAWRLCRVFMAFLKKLSFHCDSQMLHFFVLGVWSSSTMYVFFQQYVLDYFI